MQEVRRAETLWLRINGVLLILVGLTLVASQRITYTSKDEVVHTPSIEVAAKRQKTIVIPRAVGALIIGAGVTALIFATRKQHSAETLQRFRSKRCHRFNAGSAAGRPQESQRQAELETTSARIRDVNVR